MLREKLSLIYEYNNNSPLFIRAAEFQLEKNDPEKAIQIITEGIKRFPGYSTAYLALGKVLLLLGNYDEAEKAFIKGSNLINDNQTLEYYLNELEKQRAIEGYFAKSRQTSFLSDELNDILANKKNIAVKHDFIPEQKTTVPNKESFDDKLDDLAKEISAAKINVQTEQGIETETKDEPETRYKEPEIVSETIAKIYLSQGKFKEAIETYQKLIIRYPQKKNEFENTIREIKEQINESGW